MSEREEVAAILRELVAELRAQRGTGGPEMTLPDRQLLWRDGFNEALRLIGSAPLLMALIEEDPPAGRREA